MEMKEKSWIEKNKINIEKFKDMRKLYKYRQKFALNIFLNNKIITTKIYIKKTFHHVLLNPMQAYYWHKYNQVEFNSVEFHLTESSILMGKYNLSRSKKLINVDNYG